MIGWLGFGSRNCLEITAWLQAKMNENNWSRGRLYQGCQISITLFPQNLPSLTPNVLFLFS